MRKAVVAAGVGRGRTLGPEGDHTPNLSPDCGRMTSKSEVIQAEPVRHYFRLADDSLRIWPCDSKKHPLWPVGAGAGDFEVVWLGEDSVI